MVRENTNSQAGPNHTGKPPQACIGDTVVYYHGRGWPSESKVTKLYPDGAVDLQTLEIVQATGKIEIATRLAADTRGLTPIIPSWRPKPAAAGY